MRKSTFSLSHGRHFHPQKAIKEKPLSSPSLTTTTTTTRKKKKKKKKNMRRSRIILARQRLAQAALDFLCSYMCQYRPLTSVQLSLSRPSLQIFFSDFTSQGQGHTGTHVCRQDKLIKATHFIGTFSFFMLRDSLCRSVNVCKKRGFRSACVNTQAVRDPRFFAYTR